MGLFDRWRRAPSVPSLDGVLPDGSRFLPVHMSVEQMWQEQPYLRTVVEFLARNVAQLGLHAYRREQDGSRVRLRDHPLALSLSAPNEDDTAFDLRYGIVAALALYGEAYVMVSDDPVTSRVRLRPVPNEWVVGTYDSSPWAIGGYEVQPPEASEPVRVPAGDMIVFRAWNPLDPRMGSSPVDALRGVLAEQLYAAEYRAQVWRSGGRFSGVVVRPADAPKWSDEGRNRFRRMLNAAWSRDGSSAGGTMLLEDGMKFERVGFSAKDEEYTDAAKLALTTVAAAYHVNPTMVGLLDNANYSNVREFRKMLYADTLGPTLAAIEDRLNKDLVSRFDDAGLYVEFNVAEKLEGSFEEQAEVLAKAIGRPYMTPNEGRQRMNMPGIPGGDELAMPLNMAGANGGMDEGKVT